MLAQRPMHGRYRIYDMANKNEIFTQLGSTGLNRFGGKIYEEKHPKLRGTHAVETFKEMRDNDPVIGAILYSVESLFRQLDWVVNPADETEQAIKLQQLLESCMEDMTHTWDDFISEVLSMLVFGYSYFEIVYKVRKGKNQRYSDGMIGWEKIAIRAQETIEDWEFSESGDILGAYQQAPPNYMNVFLPIEKCLLFRIKSHKNSPIGRVGGILRNAYRPWYFVKRLQEYEASGIERDLSGYPCLQVPFDILGADPGTDKASVRAQLEDMIQRIRRDEDEGALIPPEVDSSGNPTGFKLQLLTSGGTRVFNTNEIIKRYETRIAQSVLAEFIMLGTESVGSFALGDAKTSFFILTLGALKDQITQVLNRSAVPRLMKLNGFADSSQWPEITASNFGNEDITLMADYISKLVSVGALDVTPGIQRKLLELGKLPVEVD